MVKTKFFSPYKKIGVAIISAVILASPQIINAQDIRPSGQVGVGSGFMNKIYEQKNRFDTYLEDCGALFEELVSDVSSYRLRTKSSVTEESTVAAEDRNTADTATYGVSEYLLLVNKNVPLERDYKPDATINIANHVKSTKGEILMEKEAGEKYIEMIEAMQAEGYYNLAAVSGYRSYDYQSNLYKNQINRYTGSMSYDEAARRAGRVVAPPGTSEHQTGLAIDVSSSTVGYSLSESFENTKEYRWILENSYKYGFIVRYAREKSDITDIIYEPWHLRYIGEEDAENIVNLGLCLEEYIEYLGLAR